MRIIARRTLTKFVESLTGHADRGSVKAALDSWFAEVKRAEWRNPGELKQQFGSASIVSSERVVFNIRGNSYRLIVAMDFEKGIVWIKWIGTHAAYDNVDASAVEFERDDR